MTYTYTVQSYNPYTLVFSVRNEGIPPVYLEGVGFMSLSSHRSELTNRNRFMYLKSKESINVGLPFVNGEMPNQLTDIIVVVYYHVKWTPIRRKDFFAFSIHKDIFNTWVWEREPLDQFKIPKSFSPDKLQDEWRSEHPGQLHPN